MMVLPAPGSSASRKRILGPADDDPRSELADADGHSWRPSVARSGLNAMIIYGFRAGEVRCPPGRVRDLPGARASAVSLRRLRRRPSQARPGSSGSRSRTSLRTSRSTRNSPRAIGTATLSISVKTRKPTEKMPAATRSSIRLG